MTPPLDLGLDALATTYRAGAATPREVVAAAAEAARSDTSNAWIHILTDAALEAYVARLENSDPEALPLYGQPFGIKDNLDLSGVPTTAACPDYAYVPERSATVVERLVEAGAVPIGKTNLDQFATGLVGTRSPYGVVSNACDAERVSGGSSSGSAVAVALGQVAFSLGTDTAGSGRVPAAFNQLYGHKPTRGWLSTRGLVPACRTLDCVSVFTRTPEEAADILAVAGDFDAEDAFARRLPSGPPPRVSGDAFEFGFPDAAGLDFDDEEQRGRFETAAVAFEALGGKRRSIDPEPLLEAGRLLYEGPWLAERRVALESVLATRAGVLYPVTRRVLEAGGDSTAEDAFAAAYRLAELARRTSCDLAGLDFLLFPTVPGPVTLAAVEADPLGANARLGTYTNCVNLLDLCAAAVPAGRASDGFPFGVTLLAPAGHDARLIHHASRLQRACVDAAGCGLPLPAPRAIGELGGDFVELAVCGAHLAGQPLNGQLLEREAVQVATVRTAPGYRLYALPGEPPARPALVRGGEAQIEIEVWRLPSRHVGSLLAEVASPLGLGRVALEDGQEVVGFICEEGGVRGASDITEYGGWRAYRAARSERAGSLHGAA